MNFVQKKEVKGTADRVALKKANEEYVECISQEFLPLFLSTNQAVNVEDYCVEKRYNMMTLD